MSVYSLLSQDIVRVPEYDITGHVIAVRGSMLKCRGIETRVSLHALCQIDSSCGKVLAEVLSVSGDETSLLVFKNSHSVKVGDIVKIVDDIANIYPDKSWLGHIIDPMCNSLNTGRSLYSGDKAYSLYRNNGEQGIRQYVLDRIDVGVKVVNTFIPCVKGQRLGIFAGSGVGKSMLLSMIGKYSKADVKIIGLIGERGIEVNKFLSSYGISDQDSSTIIVYSSSEDNAIMRRRATFVTVALAEYFRDLGLDVVCIMDSLTRFAMARREIGLQIGEIPVTKGYTSGVFEELPKLLERIGPPMTGKSGSITGFLSVLVDGDDYNEVLTDTVRGILDGQIVLNRKIAEHNIFPAIDVLASVSRASPDCYNEQEKLLVGNARKLLSVYKDIEDVVNMGLYKTGTDKNNDQAISFYKSMQGFVSQDGKVGYDLATSFKILKEIYSKV